MSQNNNFLAIPDDRDLFLPVKNGRSAEQHSSSPVDDEDVDDSRLIPRCSPVPRKRGPSIADETAEYMRIRNHFKRRVSFADATGGDLVDVREFAAFDEDEDTERWEAEEARYRTAIREPTYRLTPEFPELSGDELMRAVRAGKVEVQRLSFDADEPLEFSGTIRVLNISFSKSVYIRSTMDGWGHYFDYLADYVEGSNDGESDQFSFKLSFAPPYLFHGARIDFVVRYETSNGDFWANNSGKNYSVTLHVTYEDPLAQASAIDVHSLRGILKPGKEYEYDSEDDDDEGPRRPEPEELPRPMQPVIVHPEMDIDVGVQEQGSLSTSTSDPVQIKTTTTTTITTTPKEGSACSSIATEITPTAPATEASPSDQQDTATQANASLQLSEPEQEFGSEINQPPHPQQETQPAVQEEVEDGDVTAIPACNGVIPALTPAMPPSETSDLDPKLVVAIDIPHQLELLELAAPPLPLDQEIDLDREEDVGVTFAEKMKEEFEEMEEEVGGVDEKLREIEEETNTSERLEGSERTTITITTTPKEGSACSSIATEITPTAPATEASPSDQQDTATQANASLQLSEPEQEFGSEINQPPHPQQETQPAVQEEVEDGDVTAIPACNGVIPALTPAMPPSETSDLDPKLVVAIDIPHQLELLELAAPPLPLDQEIDLDREEDAGVTFAEKMKEEFEEMEEEVGGVDEKLREIEEETNTSERLEGSERTTITKTTTTTEGSACSSIATEFTPTAPDTEASPADEQDNATQANASLPLSEPEQEFGSEINQPLQIQQETKPAVQEEVEYGDVTAMPANHSAIPALTPAMPPSETSNVDPKLVVATDIPHQLELPELAAPPLPLDQKINVNREEDAGVSFAEQIEEEFEQMEEEFEKMEVEEVGGVDEKLRELEEETNTSERLEGSERSAITEQKSPASSHSLEERVWKGSTEDIGVEIAPLREHADLKEVPQVRPRPLTSTTDDSSGTVEISGEPELRLREDSAQAAGEDVSSSVMSHSFPTYKSPIHPGPTGEDCNTQSRLSLSDTISDAAKSLTSLQHPKPCQTRALEESSATLDSEYTNHEVLTVVSRPLELESVAEKIASPQYFSITAQATISSTTNAHGSGEGKLNVSDGTEELGSFADVSDGTEELGSLAEVCDGTEELGSLSEVCDGTEELGSLADVSYQPCMSILSSDVSEDALDQPGISALAPDTSISIGRTLRPATVGLSVVVCLIAALQEPSLFFVLGLFLVVHCF